MKDLLIRIWHWLLCEIGDHQWTTLGEQGVKPNHEKVRADCVRYFFNEYARPYCKRCGIYMHEEVLK